MTLLLALSFTYPVRLWALVAVPVLLVVYLVWTLAKRSRVSADRSSLAVLFPKRKSWKRHLAVVAATLTLASLTLAWAVPNGYAMVPRERATIFVVIDVSRSMEATDVPPNRLAAAQQAATEFVGELPNGFNVALVSFAATASLLVPPTTDRDQVDAAIANLQLAPSTAIGEGIYAALDGTTLIPPDPTNPNSPDPVAIVLLSDGGTNTGRSSTDASEASKSMGIPIYIIAYGTATGYIMEGGMKNPVPVNKAELRNIATISGGKAYSADSLSQLRDVYSGISKSVGYVQEEKEITAQFVGYGAIFGVVSLLGIMSLAARWP